MPITIKFLTPEEESDRLFGNDDEEEYSIDDGLRTCPHCGQGEYSPERGEKRCFFCQKAIDVYGELP